MGRFLNADAVDAIGANADFVSYNLFAYCANNPVDRKDSAGFFWETVLDVLSLSASIVEVAMNPTDIMAWVSLAGDAIDLIPFVTGVGEVTRAVSVTVKATENTGDLVKAARKLYNQSDAASGIRKLTGSYEIIYESGMTYVGKGGFYRATTSAKKHLNADDKVMEIIWSSAKDNKSAFIDEFKKMLKHGGPNNREIHNALSFNRIWSPGRNLVD